MALTFWGVIVNRLFRMRFWRFFSNWPSLVETYFFFSLIVVCAISIFQVFSMTLANPNHIDFPYAFSEWLINYSGGFVRRGLVGTLLLALDPQHITKLTNYLVFSTYCVCLLLFLVLTWMVFKSYLLSFLVVVSPTMLIQMAIHGSPHDIVARKEILLFCFVLYIAIRTIKSINWAVHNKVKSSIPHRWGGRGGVLAIEVFTLSALGMLIHEGFLFFSAPVLTVLLWINLWVLHHRQRNWIMILYFFALAALTALVVFYHGSEDVVQQIMLSLPGSLKAEKFFEGDAIAYLSWPPSTQLRSVDPTWVEVTSLLVKPIPLLLGYFLGFGLFLGSYRRGETSIIVSLCVVGISVGFVGISTVPMFIIGGDWLRWLTSFGVHAWILIAVLTVFWRASIYSRDLGGDPENEYAGRQKNNGAFSRWVTGGVIVTSMIWIAVVPYFGFCCDRLPMRGWSMYKDAAGDVVQAILAIPI